MDKNIELKKFLDMVYDKTPTPGGGGVSSLCGALVVSISGMVGNFTIDKKGYEDYYSEIENILKELNDSKEKFYQYIFLDEKGYGTLNNAYKMKAVTDLEKNLRNKAIEEGIKKAIEAPLLIVRECKRISDIIIRLSYIGNKMLLSDIGVAITLLKGVVEAASLNVFVNTKYLKDNILKEEIEEETENIIEYIQKIYSNNYKRIEGEIRK